MLLRRHKQVPAVEEPDKGEDFSDMSVKDLKAYAADNNIDLGDAKTKADILAVLEPDKGEDNAAG